MQKWLQDTELLYTFLISVVVLFHKLQINNIFTVKMSPYKRNLNSTNIKSMHNNGKPLRTGMQIIFPRIRIQLRNLKY